MSSRVAEMKAEIEAKQRELERIEEEEAKKNIVPPLILVLEDCINYQDEVSRLYSLSKDLTNKVFETKKAYDSFNGGSEDSLKKIARERVKQDMERRAIANTGNSHLTSAQHRECELAVPSLDDYKTNFGNRSDCVEMWNKAAPLRVKWLEACVFSRCIDAERLEPSNLLSESTKKSVKAHLVTARADVEWKNQCFQVINALTQRVADLEARLDAKQTVPLGIPVMGSIPEDAYEASGEDSGEDSGESAYESAEETGRRRLFPYW